MLLLGAGAHPDIANKKAITPRQRATGEMLQVFAAYDEVKF